MWSHLECLSHLNTMYTYLKKSKLWFILSFVVYTNGGEHPPGHLQPIGSHQPPVGDVMSVNEVPSPEQFFTEYVQPGKPVIFKQAAVNTPAFALWTDDYLSSKYGKIEVDVEEGKKENRSKELFHMPLSKFLNMYNKSDVYLVQSLPKIMRDDVYLLKCLLCGGYTDSIQDSVLWFSNGGTKSVLHFDAIDNINCLISGTKELFMVDKKDKSYIDIDVRKGSFSQVDVDKVDLYKYPGLAKVPWYHGWMDTGDCLYIPYRWFHQVRSYGPRNLAINIWFSHKLTFNSADCNNNPYKDKEFAPLSAFNVSQNFEQDIRAMIVEEINDMPVDEAKWVQIFKTLFLNGISDTADQAKGIDLVKQIFHAVDTNKDALVSPEEVIDGAFEEYQQWLSDLFPTDEEEDEENEDEENKQFEVEEKDEDDFDDEYNSLETGIKHDDL